jgi:uncharacterized membrane protein (UPF0182 family)
MRTVRDNVGSSRFRAPLLVGVGALVLLLLSASGLAKAYTDWLWFQNLGIGSVWTTTLTTQVLLAALFSVVAFFVLWGNLVLADRLAPAFRAATPEEDLIERYHQLVGDRGGKLRLLVAATFALAAGANTASQWQEWLLFRNGRDFGWADPLLGRDAGFYMFDLPFITTMVDWVFAVLILTLIVVAVAHYLNGGIRASAPLDRVTSGVKLHLSLLLAALAAVRAVGYWLDRFELLSSSRGIVDGAMATDVNVQLPAYNLLALISLFGAALFIANVRRQGWGLPMVAIGLWAVSHLVVGSIFPALYERLRVEPDASTREAEFVAHNIDATRFAYGLEAGERLTVEEFSYESGLTAEDVEAYQEVLDNVPLVDPVLAQESFTRSQAERALYQFSEELDVDRYEIDGELRPVVLSARGLNLGIEEVGQGWETQHIVFTHGYGAAVAAGWNAGTNGRLNFLARELGDVVIDDRLSETLGQPRVYFGEDLDGYAIVNAGRQEVDYQTSDNKSVFYSYEGEGGVPMGSPLRRLAFSLRFRQLDPLVAPVVNGDSEAIYVRDVAERVRMAAPFLRFDSNPYPVLANDQIYWIVDGYTTSDGFPYSQSAQTSMVDSDLAGGYNYVRNSVKAVVDAYSGEVTFYVIDPSDPVLQAWSSAFPDLFTDGDAIPAAIEDNLRYPEDIFRAQTDMWSTYVVSDPVELIQGDVAWSVAAQPRTEADVGESDPALNNRSMDPQYLITRLPDLDDDPETNNDPEFVLQRAFVPRSSGEAGSGTARPELTGVMMARSDPGHYGELVLYTVPSGLVQAPDFIHSEIRKTDELTEFVKEKQGSVVLFGEMTLLLVEDTIVYVRPVYVEANSKTAVPELSRVIAVSDERIAMGATLDDAIAGVLEGETPDQADDDADDAGDAGDDADADDSTTGDPVADDDVDEPAADADDGAGEDGSVAAYEPDGKSITQLLTDAEDLLEAADLAEVGGRQDEAATLREQAQTALTAAQELLGIQPSDPSATSGT